MTNEEKIALLYHPIQEKHKDLLDRCHSAGLNIGIFESLRTYEEQDALYAQGRTKPGIIVTNAKGGQSYHQFGLSCDYVFINEKGDWTWDGNYKKFGKIVASMKFWTWGGSWLQLPDQPHVEKNYGIALATLDQIHKSNMAGGAPLHACWRYIDDLLAG